MPDFYLLNDDHTVTATDDANLWGRKREDFDGHRVGYIELPDGVRVSTVFLGINHRFGGGGPPLIFETMAFDDNDDDFLCWRYSTWEQAEKGHAHVTSLVRDYQISGCSLADLQNEKQP